MYRYDIPTEIQSLFNKQFTYAKEPDWNLPSVSEAFSSAHEEFGELMMFKDCLNKKKNLLSDKKLDDWHKHTCFTNKAGKIVPEVRRYANAELCTQAWCKFREIICTYPLIPNEALWGHELNTIHLCEAPGAFIASLNNYLKTHDVHCDWNWVANTLNPYHEANDGLVMISDDRFIANTLAWWYFGPDNTGDLMTLKYLTGLQQFISNMSAVHLITADGSFDCQGNPGEQESLVYPLHYCEVVTCLLMLSQGGSFVLKMFTLFQHSSVNIMYLLNCCFRCVHVIKPGTSKAGNSEVYVVCLDYLGKEAVQDLLTKMIQNFETEIVNKSLFPKKCLPESFLRCHVTCCSFFYKHQADTITENLSLFPNMGEEDKVRINALREFAVSYYIQKFEIKYISRKHWLVREPVVDCSLSTRWAGIRNRRTDTYNERKQLETLTWAEKVTRGYLSPWLEDHVQYNNCFGWFLEGSSCSLKEEWYLLEGKRIPKICSSSFCDNELLKRLNETFEGCYNGESTNPFVPPPCPSCCIFTEEAVVSELLAKDVNHQNIIVCGAHSVFHFLIQRQIKASFLESEISYNCGSFLYDGDPTYQHHFLDLILKALQQMRTDDTLVLPVLSCFTRFTAGILFVLYNCFKSFSLVYLTANLVPGRNALLLFYGFQIPPNSVIYQIQQLKQHIDYLISTDSSLQVLEFVPMDILLKKSFLDYVWDLNSAIIKHKLHLIAQYYGQKT
ncbi:cap-specific mRNA (nucleoside-2'-O-)-methyltransferase 2 [Bombina bombina]|uniref:cap-specific mRNA (nucleoside-2'-O-)-methyltransferase 2 n=1 Tax=Bombina bombina TaxID=8345 RepID=UPI00235AF2F7|nr:cap-specific mRNA (nucleoside-2'-O-)-methyltransferase 2 [Bombina bombina]XP_053558351.1 cap-specific mRNA (nucleoside-2'-O-)-methyltransferase 2 [Bombina bombina]